MNIQYLCCKSTQRVFASTTKVLKLIIELQILHFANCSTYVAANRYKNENYGFKVIKVLGF